MKASKIILGGISGAVVFFLLGWLVYGVLLSEYNITNYNQCAAKPESDMIWWAIIVANFTYAFLLAFLFGWSKIKGLADGIKIAAVVGLLYSLSVDLSSYSMTNMFANLTVVVVDVLVYTAMSVLVGLVIALIMISGKKENNI